MAKKIMIRIGICCGIIISLWIVARVTGMLQFYSIPTPANEPTLKLGDKVFSSNLKTALPYHFVVFTSAYEDSVNMIYMPDHKKGTHYLHRLCAVAGNIIEMKNGVFFVNGKNFDEQLNLKVQFKIAATTLNLIDAEDQPEENSFDQYIVMGDSILITLDKPQVKKYQVKLGLIPFLLNDNYGPNGAFKWLDKNSVWTTDNFGPLKIPSGCYFVLGDNRHNAMDSRYTGFIKAADIKGVVLNK